MPLPRFPAPRRASLPAPVVLAPVLLAAVIALTVVPPVARAQESPPLPAPTVDRVGFPESYREDFRLLFTFDRPDNGSVRWIYGNDAAAQAGPGEAYPYGSVLVMEVYRAERDANDAVVIGDDGRFVRGPLFGVFVQRKEPGFGAEYEQVRSGEWEYAAYRPDGSALMPPENTGSCAQCHLQQAGAPRDYVFRAELGFAGASGAVPDGVMVHYSYLPATITVTAGATVTWSNDDEAFHTVTGDGFDSGTLEPGQTFSMRFVEPGSYAFACTFHPAMQGVVVVEAPAEAASTR